MAHHQGEASAPAGDGAPARADRGRWLRTLNVTDAPAHTDAPHCGSIGHVLPFPESCRLAQQLGFDAVNADRGFLKAHGAAHGADLLAQHNLEPAAFAFSAAFHACHDESAFQRSLSRFEQDLAVCREAGFTRCVGYVQPADDTLDFYGHFTTLCRRLKRVVPLLEAYDVRLGLEFIGPTTMRLRRKYDFIHTLDALRGLVAAAEARHCVGFKLDTMHWHTSGAGLLDIEKLSPEEVVYVELNDALEGDYDRFTLPEFERELPGASGVIDVAGMLGRLDAIGFRGPVVVEPWNDALRRLPPAKAAAKVKQALDRSLENAGIGVSARSPAPS